MGRNPVPIVTVERYSTSRAREGLLERAILRAFLDTAKLDDVGAPKHVEVTYQNAYGPQWIGRVMTAYAFVVYEGVDMQIQATFGPFKNTKPVPGCRMEFKHGYIDSNLELRPLGDDFKEIDRQKAQLERIRYARVSDLFYEEERG
jgi:hypothetical protein